MIGFNEHPAALRSLFLTELWERFSFYSLQALLILYLVLPDVLSVSGSDDATLLMDAVQKRGGRATYALIGSPTPAAHHQDRFDIDDAAMSVGVELYSNIIRRLLSSRASR